MLTFPMVLCAASVVARIAGSTCTFSQSLMVSRVSGLLSVVLVGGVLVGMILIDLTLVVMNLIVVLMVRCEDVS